MFISGHVHVLSMRKPHFQYNANRDLQQHPLVFCNEPPVARFFCKGCTWNHLHILVKASLCYDWEDLTASAQNFTLWHQATMKMPRASHLISACSRHMGVTLHAYPVRGESHIHHNTN